MLFPFPHVMHRAQEVPCPSVCVAEAWSLSSVRCPVFIFMRARIFLLTQPERQMSHEPRTVCTFQNVPSNTHTLCPSERIVLTNLEHYKLRTVCKILTLWLFKEKVCQSTLYCIANIYGNKIAYAFLFPCFPQSLKNMHNHLKQSVK